MNQMKILKLGELIEGPLARNGRWVVACIESEVPWPFVTVEITFRARQLFLMPYTRDDERDISTYPAVAMYLKGGDQDADANRLISHFLSTLSWVYRRGISVEHWTGGNLPRPMGGCKSPPPFREKFYEPYLPDPHERRARLALALYREGLTINHYAYRCLSYFKILNVLFAGGAEQIAWIDENLPRVAPGPAADRSRKIAADNASVGRHLYVSNRCAVAHAHGEPVADPEDPNDIKRLRDDLPLVQSLAEIAIEKEFGVKSSRTIFREHLYELEGFKDLVGAERLDILRKNSELPAEKYPEIPSLSIRLAPDSSYPAYENMHCRVVASERGALIVRCESGGCHVAIHLILNFPEERLHIQNGESNDDGTVSAMVEILHAVKFEFDHLMNGILEVWSANDNRLLGRCDPYIPTNVDMGRSADTYRAELERIQGEIIRRGRIA